MSAEKGQLAEAASSAFCCGCCLRQLLGLQHSCGTVSDRLTIDRYHPCRYRPSLIFKTPMLLTAMRSGAHFYHVT